jgi:hypothetical protein
MSVSNDNRFLFRKADQESEFKTTQLERPKISEAQKLGRDIRKRLDKIKEFRSGIMSKEQKSVMEESNIDQIKNFAGQ